MTQRTRPFPWRFQDREQVHSCVYVFQGGQPKKCGSGTFIKTGSPSFPEIWNRPTLEMDTYARQTLFVPKVNTQNPRLITFYKDNMACEGSFNIAKGILTEFLEKKGYRKTTERYSILREIYFSDVHLDIESLNIRMKKKNFRVSRATLYNTMDVLLESKLVRKHIFKNVTYYEKAFFDGKHDHIILTDTGEILEFSDPVIEDIKKTVEETLGVEISEHSLYFYATRKKT